MDKFQKSCLLVFLICSLIMHASSAATDSINSSKTIRDGETLVSSAGIFELGFFSPGNSTNRYLGIWYKNIPVRTYIWVANRQVPLTSNSGVLRITKSGILIILNETNGIIIWSSNVTNSLQNPAAQLLDTGNLVVKNANDENLVWQSFEYPSDSYLPGLNFGWNLITGVETYMTSWKSDEDPSPGDYSLHLDLTGYPQLVLKRGSAYLCRLGPWNGLRWSGAPEVGNITAYSYLLWMNKNEVRFRADSKLGPFFLSRYQVSSRGDGRSWTWNYQTNSWSIYTTMPGDLCENYGFCGVYGSCNAENSPFCGCLDGFVPKDPESWNKTDRSNGCVRRAPLNCQDDVFLIYSGIKLPDARNSSFNDQIISLADCKAECSWNCTCIGYTQLNISEAGSGCLFYYGDLIDIRTMATGGQDLYIRVASSDLDSKGKKRVILVAVFTSLSTMILLCLGLILFYTQKRKKDSNMRGKKKGPFSGSHGDEAELPFFDFSTILKATDSFSNKNKIGEGGFGPVFKGILEDGQEIAVKCLSKTSSQGVDEFKNEVILIAKLQHRNLVRLLGCSIHGDENMLIYEYMSNSSLNMILFDRTKSMLLDWQKRFNIINGVAKGLLYLHQDSRLRIIHRDLKASNILLDADMNPRISDFGLARSFRGNETEAQTHRVVGTYGYMSPEYAIDGLFSTKSDVFSFGVLILEVVSGKRNRGFSLKDHNLNLLGHAWRLYKEDNSCKLVDPSLGDSFNLSEVLRSIHVGLLCVQQSPEDRPSMSSVVFMLGNEVELPEAKQPGFFAERDVISAENSTALNEAYSGNQVADTSLEGR